MAQQNDELVISTPLTKYFGIKHPIILAGMYKAAGPELAAAVTNAGGIGVIGGLTFTPRILKATINHLKRNLIDKNAPFGVDLAIPKVGGTARKTNYDYTKGKLEELIDIMIECGARLFVCAIGIPPKHIVDKLHKNNILVMNMVCCFFCFFCFLILSIFNFFCNMSTILQTKLSIGWTSKTC